MRIVQALAFVQRHGYALLFLWVLAEQGAIPIPSVPLLLVAGALIHLGRLELAPALLCCVAGALTADAIWFELGRHRGHQVVRLVCRLSLEPDSCVRQTEGTFQKYGLNALFVSKFVPGLNAVAAPMAGSSRNSWRRFALYDAGGAFIWSGAYLALGYVFSGELERILGLASRMGTNMFLVVASLFALWIGWKYFQRRRFLRKLRIARITPAELHQRLAAGEDLLIMDLRSELEGAAALIPGAIRVSPEELAVRAPHIPRDRELILFCS